MYGFFFLSIFRNISLGTYSRALAKGKKIFYTQFQKSLDPSPLKIKGVVVTPPTQLMGYPNENRPVYKIFILQMCKVFLKSSNNLQIIIISNQIQLISRIQLLKTSKALMKIEVQSLEHKILNSKKIANTNLIPNIPKHLYCAHPSRNPTIAIPHNLNMKEGEKGAVIDNSVNNQILSSWIKHIYEKNKCILHKIRPQ